MSMGNSLCPVDMAMAANAQEQASMDARVMLDLAEDTIAAVTVEGMHDLYDLRTQLATLAKELPKEQKGVAEARSALASVQKSEQGLRSKAQDVQNSIHRGLGVVDNTFFDLEHLMTTEDHEHSAEMVATARSQLVLAQEALGAMDQAALELLDAIQVHTQTLEDGRSHVQVRV